MSYDVLIRRNADGEIRRRTLLDLDWDDAGSTYFWWTDGNFGCDCNRYLEFERADGQEPNLIFSDARCGETAYTVLKAILPDGREIAIDGAPETAPEPAP